MKPLTLRLAWTLGVVALVGLGLVDLAYVFDAQRQLTRERRHELAWVATMIAANVRTAPHLESYVARVSAEHAMIVSLVGDSGHIVQSKSEPEFASFIYASAPLTAKGYEHLAVPIDAAPWRYVVVSRPLKETIDRVVSRQSHVLAVLVLAAAVMTLLGLSMLRHSVLRPIERSEADRLHIAKQLEELTRAHHELQETRDRLVRAERLAAVGRLAAGLAHEVGNPLAVLTGYTSILRDETLAKATRDDALTRMDKELTRIQATVRSLLDYARAPSGVSGSTTIADVVEHVLKLVQPQASKKSVTLSSSIEDTRVAISSDALTQVLLNLVLNALDAVPEKARIAVSAKANNDDATLTVEDSGPGIPSENADKLFEPFYTTKPAGVGTGLGLSVCESLVTAAHGTIKAGKSPSLGGACFFVALPRV